MFQNNYMLDRLISKRDEIDNIIKNYQNPQVPMNVFNVGNTQIDFEAKMINKDDKPKDIIVQRKTAFICLDNNTLSIKDVNGDIVEYKIIVPKTPEQLENEKLKEQIKKLEEQLKDRSIKK